MRRTGFDPVSSGYRFQSTPKVRASAPLPTDLHANVPTERRAARDRDAVPDEHPKPRVRACPCRSDRASHGRR